MLVARRMSERALLRPSSNTLPVLAVVVGLGLVLVTLGCQSGPVRAFQGARHYAAGSEALESGDSRAALGELIEAARLVPQASEIQNHLGLALWAEGEVEPARRAFERAVELDCDNQAARGNLERLTKAPQSGPFADRRRARANEEQETSPTAGGGERDGG